MTYTGICRRLHLRSGIFHPKRPFPGHGSLSHGALLDLQSKNKQKSHLHLFDWSWNSTFRVWLFAHMCNDNVCFMVLLHVNKALTCSFGSECQTLTPKVFIFWIETSKYLHFGHSFHLISMALTKILKHHSCGWSRQCCGGAEPGELPRDRASFLDTGFSVQPWLSENSEGAVGSAVGCGTGPGLGHKLQMSVMD